MPASEYTVIDAESMLWSSAIVPFTLKVEPYPVAESNVVAPGLVMTNTGAELSISYAREVEPEL